MAHQILTRHQKAFLDCVAKYPGFNKRFYLTGGTALAVFYLQHRDSEDLDFFSEEEIPPLEISAFIRSLKKDFPYRKAELQVRLNRHLCFLTFSKGPELKVEFTYYPGPPVAPRKRFKGILVDSLLDIAVNKAFTIAQNARTRDFIDLYLILQREKWTFQDLLKKARTKFDVYVDPIQIGSQLMRVKDLCDYPRMIEKIDDREWQDYFLKEARKLKSKLLKS